MEVQYQPGVGIPSHPVLGWPTISKAPPAVDNEGDYQIVKLTEKDGDRMVDFMRRFFFKDEPLNVNVNLVESDGDRCVELEEYCLSCIADGLSLLAVSPSGEIVGVCINGIGEPGHLEEMEFGADSCPNPKFRKILRLLAHVERHADVYSKFPDIDKVLEVKMVSVDDSWRGKGIATTLIGRTRELTRQEGIRLMRVDCTSNFSGRAAVRLGMECIYTLQYEHYTADGQDQPIFTPPLPHTSVRTFVQLM